MFSIIITTYNSEEYIEKTLKSIFQASKNISKEIIVVDDGSNDNTLNILTRFKDIQLIQQVNNGVSSARNKGLKCISKNSELVTFIDDSDWISSNFFEASVKFFEKYKDIQLAVTPIKVLENNIERDHSLNYRFNNSKEIVNILEDYTFIHFHIGGVVFRSEILSSRYKIFDENINFWEDAKFINHLLIYEQQYGLISNAIYYYNRDDCSSLSKASWKHASRYNEHITYNFFPLIHDSLNIYGEVIKYVQYAIVIHYLQFMFSYNFKFIDVNYILKGNNFLHLSKKLFRYIDKEIIDDLKINKRYKYFLNNLKNIKYTNKEHNYISVYIHTFNLFKKAITFSFSEETFNISDNSRVFLKKRHKNKPVLFLEKNKKDILHYLSNDFSRNIYFFKFEFKDLFFKNIFVIKDDKQQFIIEVSSESILKRILKKLKIFISKKKGGRK